MNEVVERTLVMVLRVPVGVDPDPPPPPLLSVWPPAFPCPGTVTPAAPPLPPPMLLCAADGEEGEMVVAILVEGLRG